MYKIAIFRALFLGDFLCSIPALRALRKSFPEAEISLIGLAGMKDLAGRYSQYIDHFITFPGFPLLTDNDFDPDVFAHFLKEMRNKEFDLILQMQGNGEIINNLLSTFNAKVVSGFCPTQKEENKYFVLYPEKLHEIERHLFLLRHNGIASDGTNIDFPITEIDQIDYKRAALPILKKYVCIHPGSKAEWRQWPVQYFAEIADFIAERGFQIVITGISPEVYLAQRLVDLMKHEPIIAAGKLSLGGSAVLLSNASFLLSNCTGISHLAAALKVPSLIISMDGEPHRWGPINKKLQKTIDWKSNSEYNAVFKEIESIFLIDSHISSGDG